jgi:hypothetical protein
VRAYPGLRLVVLAKHGLVVWGDTAREAYEQTVAVCNQAAELANRRSEHVRRFGGPAGSGGGLDADARAARLAQVAPALRGAVSSARAKVLLVDVSEPVCELVDSVQGAEIATVGAACPDHLVHTKRLPMWVPYDPARDSIEELQSRVSAGAAGYRQHYQAYFERHAGDDDVMADPDPRVVLIENVGMVAVGQTPKAARISRDLYHRAIEVMAGAGAVSEFVSLTALESFAVEYWPLELYKLSLAPAPGELQGKVALVTGPAGGIGRAVLHALTGAGASVVAFDIDGDGAADAVAEMGDAGISVGGDVTAEAAVAAAFAAAVETFGGLDIVISNAGIASSAPIARPRSPSGSATSRCLAPATSWSRARPFASWKRRAGAARLCSSPQERARRRTQCLGLLQRQGGGAAPRPLPGRRGRGGRDPRQHGQSGRGAAGVADLGLELARGARRRVRDRGRRARGALPPAHHARGKRAAVRHRRGGPALRVLGAVGQEHRKPPERRRRGHRGVPALGRESCAMGTCLGDRGL